jgi:hypothetical protein
MAGRAVVGVTIVSAATQRVAGAARDHDHAKPWCPVAAIGAFHA